MEDIRPGPQRQGDFSLPVETPTSFHHQWRDTDFPITIRHTRMSKPTPIPDTLFHLSLYIGGIGFVMLTGLGFVARAQDSPGWPWWIAAPFCLIPLVTIICLTQTGAIKLVEMEKVERRLLKRLPPLPARVSLALAVLIYAVQFVCFVLGHMADWMPDRFDKIAESVGSLVGARMAAAGAALAIIGLLLWIPAVWKEFKSLEHP